MISIDGAELRPYGPVFATAKAAIARVSDVVRSCAAAGAPRTVELQVLTIAGGDWRTVEVWGPDVVARIGAQVVRPSPRRVEQSGRSTPATRLQGLVRLDAAADPPVFGLPECMPEDAADSLPAIQAAFQARRPKRQRWHLIGTAGLLVIVWSALLYWMTGGEIAALWTGPTASAAMTEDLRWAREGGAQELAAPAAERLSAE